MKPTFKTTALAILVSLGATACLSSSDSSKPAAQPTPVQPTQPNQPSQPNQPAQPEQPSQPTQPAQPTNPTTPTNPATPTVPEANGDNSDLTIEITPIGAPITVETPAGYDFAAASKMSDGTVWRAVDMKLGDSKNLPDGSGFFTVLADGDSLTEGSLNLNEIGENKLGWHKGTVTQNGKAIDYTFVNQPYSSYGMLSTDTAADPMTRAATTAGGKTTVAFMNVYLPYNERQNRNVWDEVMGFGGKATYKGGVIARADDLNGNEIMSPRYDGDITLTVAANPNVNPTDFPQHYLFVSGEFDSKSLGEKIRLGGNSDMSPLLNQLEHAYAGIDDKVKGEFNAYIAGKGHSNVVEDVTLFPSPGLLKVDGKEIGIYKAVFGGQR